MVVRVPKVELSQIIFGVRNLDAATRRFERMGLSVLDGGRHPGVGTANRVIPLGRQYVELLGVVDEQEAQTTEYGRSLLARTRDRDRLVRWSLRTDDIESVARRLGLAVQQRSRVRPDGVRLTWRAAGLELALAHPWLPFFMQWDKESHYPGRMPAQHALGASGVAWLEVAPGDDRWGAWTAGTDVPLRSMTGEPGLLRVALATAHGELILSPEP